MAWPPTHRDLYAYGLPPEACVRDARQVDSVNVGANLFELRGHGYAGGERVRITTRNGSLPAAIPSPLAWQTVSPTNDPDLFALVGVTLADAGAGQLSVVEDITAKLDDAMAVRAAWLVSWYKASQGPWTVAPQWGPMIVAHLCAFDVAKQLRIPDARYPAEMIQKAYDDAKAFLDNLDKGEPYGDGVGPVDATPKVAEMGPVAVQLAGRGYTGRRRGGSLSFDDREDRA